MDDRRVCFPFLLSSSRASFVAITYTHSHTHTPNRYGEQLDEGPYILENLVETLKKNGTKTEKLELMTAAMKLFFKRPPEAQKLLGSILNAILDPEANVDADLHDRALFFYRLLREDIESAEKIVNASKGGAVRAFAEEANNEIRERVFRELNTLSVLYVVFSNVGENFNHIPQILRVSQLVITTHSKITNIVCITHIYRRMLRKL